MKELIFTSPFFGIAVSIFAYALGVAINKKTKIALFNPLLISYIIIIALMLALDIPLEYYNNGGDIIDMFLSPATAVLAITVYRQRHVLKDHLAAVIVGSAAGSVTSLCTVFLLSKAFNLEEIIFNSLLSKGITTPMAIAVSESLGGIEAITVLAVIVTGVGGNIFGPVLIRIFRIKSEIAQGMALGTASHAVGTSRAIELGEVQGALSSIALVLTGIITVILSLIVFV